MNFIIKYMKIDKDDIALWLILILTILFIVYILYIDWKWRTIVVPCLIQNI